MCCAHELTAFYLHIYILCIQFIFYNRNLQYFQQGSLESSRLKFQHSQIATYTQKKSHLVYFAAASAAWNSNLHYVCKFKNCHCYSLVDSEKLYLPYLKSLSIHIRNGKIFLPLLPTCPYFVAQQSCIMLMLLNLEHTWWKNKAYTL